MNQANAQTIRKAAILVASLDEQQGRQLTGGLSASDADLLGQAVADLGPIDPEERLEVFQELRRVHPVNLSWKKRPGKGVELDWSPSTTEKFGAQDQYATETVRHLPGAATGNAPQRRAPYRSFTDQPQQTVRVF